MPSQAFKEKVVIITGASSGIGKACAEAFALEGALVVLSARNTTNLENVRRRIASYNADVLVIEADVSKESDCKKIIAETIDRFGRIDILINNAGISMRAVFKDVDLPVLRRLMEVNFWGMVYCTKFALPQLLKNKGTVVGISSIAGYRGLPGRTGYSASKFAMNGFLEALRSENVNSGLNVLTVSPGYTASNIRNTALNSQGKPQMESPLNEQRIMTAEEVADHVLTAIKKRKRTLILTRKGKLTVFLNKWMPGIMDKVVYNYIKKEKDSPFR